MTQEVTSMARIKMPAARSKAQEITFEEAFNIFLTDSAARGLAEKTLKTYRNHLHCISLYVDISTPLGKLSKKRATARPSLFFVFYLLTHLPVESKVRVALSCVK